MNQRALRLRTAVVGATLAATAVGLGGLVVVSQQSALASLIYTVF